MRVVLLAAALATFPAHGDLYRWVDPASGSVKYSSVAPAWQGEPGRPRVEVLTSQPQAAAAKDKPGEAPAARLIQAQIEAYQAVLAQLDRVDPAGKKRREAEEALVLEKLQKK